MIRGVDGVAEVLPDRELVGVDHLAGRGTEAVALEDGPVKIDAPVLLHQRERGDPERGNVLRVEAQEAVLVQSLRKPACS